MRPFLIAALGAAFLLSSVLAAAQDPVQESPQEPTQPASQMPAESTRVSIHGLVRNAATGEPLARVLVHIEGDADTGALTDSEGRFEIPGVPVGPQIISVVKPGFRDRPYATEETGLQAEGPSHSVMVAAQMPELDFTLSPNGAIHGRIELSTGDPAESMTLILLRQVVRSGRAAWAQVSSTRTNGEGAYRFGGLPDGVYIVYNQPALESEPAVSAIAAASAANIARSGYPTVYYPDARDLAGASRIRVSNGSQAEANLSLPLEPFYPVTALGAAQADAASGTKDGGLAGYTSVIMDASGHQLPYSAQFDPTTHSLQASLPDGTYNLVVRGSQSIQPAGDGLNGGAFMIGRQSRSGALAGSVEFTVAGHPVTGLRVPLAPPQPAIVNLRVVRNTDNSTSTSGNGQDIVRLALDPADGVPLGSGETTWSMENDSDSIRFTAQPGTYWVNAYVNRKGLCAASMTAGSFNLAHEPLAMSLATAPPPMELTLRDDCGTLTLNLPPTLSSFLPGEEPYYTVYVVPDFDTVVEIPPMTMHPSSGPALTLDSLTPGSYHVYAFDSPVHLEYRNPAAMSEQPNPGQQVTVTAGSTATLALEVPEH
jgi:Carboxypeptidase regulatory-like domain